MNSPIEIKADKRFKLGNIKRSGSELRGHPDTVKMERMEIPSAAPLSMKLNPPIVVSPELAKAIKKEK